MAAPQLTVKQFASIVTGQQGPPWRLAIQPGQQPAAPVSLRSLIAEMSATEVLTFFQVRNPNIFLAPGSLSAADQELLLATTCMSRDDLHLFAANLPADLSLVYISPDWKTLGLRGTMASFAQVNFGVITGVNGAPPAAGTVTAPSATITVNNSLPFGLSPSGAGGLATGAGATGVATGTAWVWQGWKAFGAAAKAFKLAGGEAGGEAAVTAGTEAAVEAAGAGLGGFALVTEGITQGAVVALTVIEFARPNSTDRWDSPNHVGPVRASHSRCPAAGQHAAEHSKYRTRERSAPAGNPRASSHGPADVWSAADISW